MNPCNIPKKTRAPRRASVLFASLPIGTEFWLPGRKSACLKAGIITAGNRSGAVCLDNSRTYERFFINPFRSVFVTAPKKAEPESEIHRAMREDAERMQAEAAEILKGESPYVALVQGGCPCNANPEHWERAGGTTPEQNEAHFAGPVVQPHNDNNITGPTS